MGNKVGEFALSGISVDILIELFTVVLEVVAVGKDREVLLIKFT